MRLHGYCTGCRRIKLVSVTGHALALATAACGGVVQGVCAKCEEDARPRCDAPILGGPARCGLVRGHNGNHAPRGRS